MSTGSPTWTPASTYLAEHHEERLAETVDILAAAGAAGLTAWQVATGVTWSRPGPTWSSFQRQAAVGEVLSHLRHLQARGLATESDIDGVGIWTAPGSPDRRTCTARTRERLALADRHAWIEEGAHLVAPGVHRIPLPLPSDGLRAVNVYAIEAADGLVLIDSGWALANARDQLERSLAAHRGRPAGRTPVPGHAPAPRPLHAGDRDPAAVRHAGGARRGGEALDRRAASASSGRSGRS